MPTNNPGTARGPLTARIQSRETDSQVAASVRAPAAEADPQAVAAAAPKPVPVPAPTPNGQARYGAFEVDAAAPLSPPAAARAGWPGIGPRADKAWALKDGTSIRLSFNQMRECRELVAVMRRVAILRREIAGAQSPLGDRTEEDDTLDLTMTAAELTARRSELEALLTRAETIAVGIASGVPGEPDPAPRSRHGRERTVGPGRRVSFTRQPVLSIVAASVIGLATMASFATGNALGRPARAVSDEALPMTFTSTARESDRALVRELARPVDPITTAVSEGSGIVFFREPKGAAAAESVVITAVEDAEILEVLEGERSTAEVEES